MCNDPVYLTVYENAAIHSQGTRNPEVHDMIMHASHVTGRGQELGVCMALKKDWCTVNIHEFLEFCTGDSTEDKLMQ